MKLPKRFALSTLLLLMLVVAAVFGYAQWRRQWLIGEIDRLKSVGVAMAGLNGNWFWPRLRHAQAEVRCLSCSPLMYIPPIFAIRGTVVNTEDAHLFYAEIAKQLNALGVEDDQITYVWHHYISSAHHGKQFKDVVVLSRPFFDDFGREQQGGDAAAIAGVVQKVK